MHELTCTPARTRLAEGTGQDLDLLVMFRAPPPPRSLRRAPLCMLPVVDVSGSMEGPKLEGVKRALGKLAAHLVPGDFLGLVKFDSTASVVAEVAELTQASRTRFLHEVARLEAGSSTNLADGLLGAAAHLAISRLPAAVRTRVIALTDGLANAGPVQAPADLSALVRKTFDAVTLSAFGYGNDCDQAVLTDLAEGGGGSFAFIDSDDAVLTAFARELGGLVTTYAADVRVAVTVPGAAPVEERLGDLLFGAELSTVLRVAVPSRPAGITLKVARVELRWRDAAGREQREVVEPAVAFVPAADADRTDALDVARCRDERSVREAQEKAEELARQGNFRGAQQVLEAIAAKIRDPALAAFVREKLLLSYDDQASYRTGSQQRSSSLAALKRKRQLRASKDVASTFRVEPNAVEKQLEDSFLSPAPTSPRRRLH